MQLKGFTAKEIKLMGTACELSQGCTAPYFELIMRLYTQKVHTNTHAHAHARTC